jgi:cell division septal protein FtsQ
MNCRLLGWAIGGVWLGVSLVGAAVVPIAAAQSDEPVFIAGDRPVTEDQIRQKLRSEGYANVQILRRDRYFEAMASKDGQTETIVVDSQTGRLRAGKRRPVDDDDD